MTAALLLVGTVVLLAAAHYTLRNVHRKPKRTKDALPPDRVVGDVVYRAFRIPATTTVEAFTDALDLTLAEAASWNPATGPTPPGIRARQQERYRNWLRARKGKPSRVQAAEDGEAPKPTARPVHLRPAKATAGTPRRTMPRTALRNRRSPSARRRQPLKTVGHYPLGRVRQVPNFIIGDSPGVERRCSCGAHFQGSADDVAERWHAHLHADERTFGSKAADQVFAWLEKHQERVVGRLERVDKARSLVKTTSLLSVLFFLALSIDAGRGERLRRRWSRLGILEARLRAAMGADRCGERPLDGPSVLQAASEHAGITADAPSPGRHGHGLAVEGQEHVAGGIARLLFRCGPSTVVRLIVAIAVDAVNRVLGSWFGSHVGQEVLERVPPAVADGDATTAVEVPARRRGLVATSLHLPPRPVLGSLRASVHSVAGRSAAATKRLPEPEFAQPGIAFDPAVASDDHVAVALAPPALTLAEDNEAAESLSDCDRRRLKATLLTEFRRSLLRSAALGARDLRDRHPFQFSPAGFHCFHDPEIAKIAHAARAVGATATAITANTGAQTWGTNGAWVSGVQPTAADDVTIPNTSTVTIASGTTALCRSLTVQAGGTVAFAATTSNLNIGDASGGALTISSTGTITLTAIGTINFLSTSTNGGAGWGIDPGGTGVGHVLPNLVFNGAGGSWIFAAAVTATSANVSLSAGTLNTNGMALTCSKVIPGATSTTRVLTLGGSTITCSNAGLAWDATTATGLTLNANTSAITLNGSGSTFTGGALTYNSVSLTGAGTATVNGGNTFTNFTRTGSAAKTDVLTFSGGQTVTGTLTLAGNTTQGVNRLLAQSSAIGTQRSLTVGSVVISGDVDFSDIAITYSGGASWTNAGAAYVGDVGGNNSTVTTNRTAPANQTATGTASFTWSTHGWTSRVPLPQDNVFIPNAFVAGRTITADMPRLGASVDFTGGSGSPILSVTTNTSIFGSLTLVTGVVPSGTSTITFAGRSAYTITSAGATFTGTVSINAPSGTYTLQDALTVSRSASGASFMGLTLGTFVDNGFSVTSSGSDAQLTMTGGTLTKTGVWSIATTTARTFWSVTAGTISDTGSTTLTVASANTRSFAGGSKTYGTLTYTVAGSTGSLTVTGANTFSVINFSDATNARTLTLPASTTTTVTNINGIVGTAGKLMSVVSSAGGTPATLATTAGGTMAYVSLQDISATPSGAVYALDSTNVSGNSGIVFSPPDVMPVAHRPRELLQAVHRAGSY